VRVAEGDGVDGPRLDMGAYEAQQVPTFATGDYNQNGTVDAADYVVWRKGLGAIYTQNDYNVWRTNFGRTAASGSGAAAGPASSAVPELAALQLLLGVAALAAAYCRVH
jgi:hypothetical protein